VGFLSAYSAHFAAFLFGIQFHIGITGSDP